MAASVSFVTGEMTNAEFRSLREFLGLSPALIATLLDVEERSVTRWDTDHRIPEGVSIWLRQVEAETADLVRKEVERLRGGPEPTIRVCMNDEELAVDWPDCPYDARWQRAWVARVLQQVPNLKVTQ